MPTLGRIKCEMLVGTDSSVPFPEHSVSYPTSGSVTCYVAVDATKDSNNEQPYSVRWTIDPSLLRHGGVQVQVEVDGCQKGQPRCYEAIAEDGLLPSSVSGTDDGLWVVPDGTRRRPWIMSPIKTTHPHSALADKYILDRVGSVNVTLRRADVVPTSHVVPLAPVFNGGAPLPERMGEKVSHWTKLGYIRNHPLAPELGLVAETVGEVIASFTFYYRSQDLLDQFMRPVQNPTIEFPSPAEQQSPNEVKFSFPAASRAHTPDVDSVRSAEAMSSTLSDGGTQPTKPTNPAGVLRRALTTHNTPRTSVDGVSAAEKDSEKNEFGKFSKLGGKRVRAVSLRMSKRYSLLGKSGGEKSSQKESTDEVAIDMPLSDKREENLDTIEGLKKELLRLRLEIASIKNHLNL
ncbi:hypothetical protein CROQUDRAFT_81439 [Cronartium quercuum f. sp. fusiforme G11]|uniref:DUF7918 domain-containing protein n=1 Tax=Cronartium quercuum f. sp. fusiforme G11 TaxID=708437 RepID=A0A9P6NAS0_9BASI|nr:hypothetical protein CROQUDRAFT_81439 [Cronartium quercuum f. sp. fusiforme G11]